MGIACRAAQPRLDSLSAARGASRFSSTRWHAANGPADHAVASGAQRNCRMPLEKKSAFELPRPRPTRANALVAIQLQRVAQSHRKTQACISLHRQGTVQIDTTHAARTWRVGAVATNTRPPNKVIGTQRTFPPRPNSSRYQQANVQLRGDFSKSPQLNKRRFSVETP